MNRFIKQNESTSDINWKALAYFNLYRTSAAVLFLGLILIGRLPEPLGIYNQQLFTWAVASYFLLTFVSWFVIRSRLLGYVVQVSVHVLVDIIVFTLMMYASNGLSSGFGMLLVITVASGSILIAGRIAILIAAIATLAVLGHELYIHFLRLYLQPNYTHAGFLGATFFVTAILGHILAARVQETEALAEQRAIDLEKLAYLNEHIVQRMQSGIIVFDKDCVIRLINSSASQMLGLTIDVMGKNIHDISPQLAEVVENRSTYRPNQVKEIHTESSNLDLRVSFAEMDEQEGGGLIVFLDDATQLRQQAQSLKLASLGRLTASIAHEVRNPLGAISHAGQLLSESKNIAREDGRLTQIIQEHSTRVNNIIENVLSISRRDLPAQELIELEPWMHKFIDEFTEQFNIPEDEIVLSVNHSGLKILFDSTQLHQIVYNLSENALRYSKGHEKIRYECGIYQDLGRPYMDIIDTGQGMSTDNQQHLFEPFFTTERKGSGLGLYIARELCEANQASLNLYKNTEYGCHFRIIFSHPDKRQFI